MAFLNINYFTFLFYKIWKLIRNVSPIILINKLFLKVHSRIIYNNSNLQKSWNAKINNIINSETNTNFLNFLETGFFGNIKTSIKFFEHLCHKDENEIILEADNLLKYNFILYKNIRLNYDNSKFSWHSAPTNKNHIRNNLLISMDLPHAFNNDIKNIWEISRFNFLDTLTKAFVITKNKIYLDFSISLISDWINKNPYLEGPNWRMPMEISIRIFNWCFYLPIINYYLPLNKEIYNNIFISISQQIYFLEKRLEYSFFKENNHFFSNVICLLIKEKVFSNSFSNSFDSNQTVKEYFKQVDLQFDESGFNFEGSLSYHFFCTEMLIAGLILLGDREFPISKQFQTKLKNILKLNIFSNSLSENFPLIGDNDSGTYLSLFAGNIHAFHFLQALIYKALLKDIKSLPSISEFFQEIQINHKTQRIKENSLNFLDNENFDDIQNFSGLIIAKKGNTGFYFNTSKSSQGHTHNDKLSFYPVIEDDLLFVDRGSFSYTGNPQIRKIDRSSLSHNCLVINSWEQNRFWDYDPFFILDDSKCYSSIDTHNNLIIVTAYHIGYEKYRKGIRVFRQIMWNDRKRCFLIKDWVDYKNSIENFKLSWNFLINPDWDVKQYKNKFTFSLNNKKLIFENCSEVYFQLSKSKFCPGYQTENECLSLKGSILAKNDNSYIFKLIY